MIFHGIAKVELAPCGVGLSCESDRFILGCRGRGPQDFPSDNATDADITKCNYAIYVALKKLKEGCSVEDAMAVCELGVLDQIMKWKSKNTIESKRRGSGSTSSCSGRSGIDDYVGRGGSSQYNSYGGVRDELERLLDDDDDMADLYLSRKLFSASPVIRKPTRNSKAEANFLEVEQRVIDILKKIGRDPYSISKSVIKTFRRLSQDNATDAGHHKIGIILLILGGFAWYYTHAYIEDGVTFIAISSLTFLAKDLKSQHSIPAVVNGAILPIFGCLLALFINSFNKPAHELHKDSEFWALMFLVLESGVRMEIAWFDKTENSSAVIGARLSADAESVRGLVGDNLSLIVQNTATAVCGLIIAFVGN
ncbi:ABC transporter B family member 11-like protein isoform X1 [Tanacetum coccineum]